MPTFDECQGGTWGMAFFRAVTKKVLQLKIDNMTKSKCAEKYPCGVDWTWATTVDYACRCPRRRQLNMDRPEPGPIKKSQECKHIDVCSLAMLYDTTARESKDIEVSVPIHTQVTAEVEQLLGPSRKKILAFARKFWKAIETCKEPLEEMTSTYKKEILGL